MDPVLYDIFYPFSLPSLKKAGKEKENEVAKPVLTQYILWGHEYNWIGSLKVKKRVFLFKYGDYIIFRCKIIIYLKKLFFLNVNFDLDDKF